MPDWVLPIVGMMIAQLVAAGGIVFAAGSFIGKVQTSFETIHKDIRDLTFEIRGERAERMNEIRRLWKAHNEHASDHNQHSVS